MVLAVILSLAICFSTCVFSGIVASAEEAEPINVVYSDDFSADSLSDEWEYMADGAVTDDGKSYTSAIDNDMLKVMTNKESRSAIAGCLYLPGKESVNQRVSVETKDLQKGDSIYVYARLNKSDSKDWKSLKGYYVSYHTNTDGKSANVRLYKYDTAYAAISRAPVMQCGYRGYSQGENYRIELVVTGTDRTVITVRMIKTANNLVVAQGTYVDTDSPFLSGTAGIGVAGSSASANDYAYLDNFEYTSTDNVKDTPKYLSHSRKVDMKTFGQVVTLEKGVEYVLAAYGTVDYTNKDGYMNEPLWVASQTSSNRFDSTTVQNIIETRSEINKTSNLTKKECKENNLEYSEYNVSYVTFTADGYEDSYLNNRIIHVVGIRLNKSEYLVGNYSYFTLYRRDDPQRTNLLVNPDFKMGLYGWCDTVNACFGYEQGKETSSVLSKNSSVTLLSDKNNYEYYEMFKNPAYLCTQGDINKDLYFDVSDLVYTDTMSEYYYLADYDKNGSIDDLDVSMLKIDLLNRVAAKKKAQKIARIGYRPYDSSTPPEQSLESYRLAYQMGYKILLCDVRTTSDGYFVALHDKTINSYARNSEGQSIKNSDPININDITLAEADTYDFGIYKGSQYAGTKIMRVEEFIALCKELGVTTHLELKETFTNEKLDELIALIKSYGIENDLMINGQNADNLRYIADKLPNAIMGTWVQGITDTLINQISTYGENNPKFIYVSNGGEATITPENYVKCQEKGIDIAYTEIRNEEELQNFKDLGLLDYCKYVATRYDLY